MIIIDIDMAISKTNTIIFEIEVAYVSNLAHPWLDYLDLACTQDSHFSIWANVTIFLHL
jgi:hypothetical protein